MLATLVLFAYLAFRRLALSSELDVLRGVADQQKRTLRPDPEADVYVARAQDYTRYVLGNGLNGHNTSTTMQFSLGLEGELGQARARGPRVHREARPAQAAGHQRLGVGVGRVVVRDPVVVGVWIVGAGMSAGAGSGRVKARMGAAGR